MDRIIKILRSILIVFILVWLAVWFTQRSLEKEERERNFAEQVMVDLSRAPDLAKDYLKNSNDHLERNFRKGPDLFPIGDAAHLSCVGDSLYMLHYRVLGRDEGEVWLQNIQNGKIAWRWSIPLDEIMKDIRQMDDELSKRYQEGKFISHFDNYITRNMLALNVHTPVMTADSSLLFNLILGYLYKLDKNSNLLWKSEKLSHHSIELDEAGNIWTCSVDLDNDFANKNGYRDDAILCLGQDGSEKAFFSLTDMFRQNDLFERLIISTQTLHQESSFDPFHINDVLPVPFDGPYWQKGDLFFSLRHQSMIALYRPSTGRIVWYQKGPWLTQHDINIINDSTISVFNNNAFFEEVLDRGSNIAVYHFDSGETTYKADQLFNSHSNGRENLLSDGTLIIEETDRFKYWVIGKDGDLKCRFYIPYYSDSTKAQYPGWSKFYILSENNFIAQ